MDADSGYDTANFQALRQELNQLNARVTRRGRVHRDAAFAPSASMGSAKRASAKKATALKKAAAPANPATGVKATATKSKVKPAAKVKPASNDKKTTARRPQIKAADKGKARARRLLAMLERIAGDDSRAVPGTDFTEAGVVRLLAYLRKRLSQTSPFLVRLQRVLSRPVAMGVRTSAGVSVERLQLVSRQLRDIETLGWVRFQDIRDARRGKQPLSPLSMAAAAPRPSDISRKPQAKTAVLESQ